MTSQRIRGWVRSVEVAPALGNPRQLIVEIRLADLRGHEEYARWRSEHYLGNSLVDVLNIHHGDDVEVHLDPKADDRYGRHSFVQNHTRSIRYTLTKPKRAGCLPVMVVLVCLPLGALALTIMWQ